MHVLKSCLVLAGLLFLTPGSAYPSPSFQIEISFGGATELAVGESLQCHAFAPTVFRDARKGDPLPLGIPLTWRLETKGAATIDATGRITARAPGVVVVKVSDGRKLPKGQLPAGTDGSRRLQIRAKKEVPGGRLPRVAGLAALDQLAVDWKAGKPGEVPTLQASVGTKRWHLWFDALLPESAIEGDPPPLPWKLEADKRERAFRLAAYIGVLSEHHAKEWRANLKQATLGIHGYKDGIAKGTLRYKTALGVEGNLSFVARIPDPKGRLAKAAALQKSKTSSGAAAKDEAGAKDAGRKKK